MSSLFMAYDGDDAGKLVGRAVLANDVAGLHEVSKRIATGHEVVSLWVEQNGGQVISGGGDEGTFSIPPAALEGVEQLRSDYQFATQLTMTVGVGASLSEAGKSLMAGKFRGKNQVVQYDPSVDQDLSDAQARVAQGAGSDEEQKITEAYLQGPAPAAPAAGAEPHCEYCAEFDHEHGGDDCELCVQANAQDHEHTDDCEYCVAADAEAAAPDHAHTDDCEYCQQADAAAAAPAAEPHCEYCAQYEHEHSGDDCEYCRDANAQAPAAVDPLAAVAPTQGTMEGNISRPEGYSEDAGVPQDTNGAPALHDVLQEGLDSQEDQIAKERAMNMIGQALVGFSSQKHIFERAQTMAPEMYQATIMMLKAMIEMGKMLGLEPKQAEAMAEQAPQADPSGQPAAPQGDAAQAPQQ